MTFKKAVGKVHLWLGLASGLIVVFLGVTGCMLAFQKEIEYFTTASYTNVTNQHKAMLPPSALKEIADAQLPGKIAHSVTYGDSTKAAEVAFYNLEPSYYYITYLDPYTGEVLKVKHMDRDFFRVVIMGHYYLWLPPNIGQPILASATLIFLVMMISGLILWWPKNKAASKQRFRFKWKPTTKWRRKNYDFHNVLGFYMTWVAIFIAITGLVMGFQWFAKTVYWTTSGGKQQVAFYEAVSKPNQQYAGKMPAIDAVWEIMKAEYKQVDHIEVHFPGNDSVAIEGAANPSGDTYWKADYRYFDQHTLEEIEVNHPFGKLSKASVADKISRMNYDIHVGAVLGLPGKCLAFFGSLIAASLPITGFLIWWGRRKKHKQKHTYDVAPARLIIQKT